MTVFAPCESVFAGNHFRIRQKGMTLFFSSRYWVEHRSGQKLAFASETPFSLEEIRLYTDENRTTELFSIKQRALFEWRTNYDVSDSTTGQPIGSVRGSALGEYAAIQWTILDALDQEIVTVGARYPFFELPFSSRQFFFNRGLRQVASAKLTRNPFAPKIQLDLSAVPSETLDRRLAIAFGLLVLVTEANKR